MGAKEKLLLSHVLSVRRAWTRRAAPTSTLSIPAGSPSDAGTTPKKSLLSHVSPRQPVLCTNKEPLTTTL